MPLLLVRWSLPSCAYANFYSSDMSIALPAFNRSECQFLILWIEIWPANRGSSFKAWYVHSTGITLWTTREITYNYDYSQYKHSHHMQMHDEFQLLPSLQALFIMIFCYCTCTHMIDLLYQCWGFDCYLWLNWFLNVSIQCTVHIVVVLTCTDSISNYCQKLLNSGQNSRLIANKNLKTVHDGRG